jgi:hypothetical protein
MSGIIVLLEMESAEIKTLNYNIKYTNFRALAAKNR